MNVLFSRATPTGVLISARFLHIQCDDTLMVDLTQNGQKGGVFTMPITAKAERGSPLVVVGTGTAAVAVHVGRQVTLVSWTDSTGRRDQMAPVEGWAVLATQARVESPHPLVTNTTVVASDATGTVASARVQFQPPQFGGFPPASPSDC
jgi:hypothetical protein